MEISYIRLWHLLLDRHMKKIDLQRISGISSYTIKRMTRNESIQIDDLGKICLALNCKPDDIVDFICDKNYYPLTLEFEDAKDKKIQ